MGEVDRLRSALAGRYALEHVLGRGGMATVYLAHDPRHERRVAIKVLKAELAVALGPDRFLRETKLTAQLNHPHILPLLDSGEANGLLYYVMPYMEGESLRDRLNRETQLSVEAALQIAREVADALNYAHSRGVIHRDIKPENILLGSGHAVVADFGVARVMAPPASERLTETGLAVGTPAYMSPEQATGSARLDGRSDVYSLACVLYEMLTGDPPFGGRSPHAIVARTLADPPMPLRTVRPSIPMRVEQAVLKALSKVPADRFDTAAEFRAVLDTSRLSAGVRRATFRLPQRALLGAAALALVGTASAVWLFRSGPWRGMDVARSLGDQRVAVLYFNDMSPRHSISYLADGLTEALIDTLRQVKPKQVISSEGVDRFRNSALPADSIGRVLHVDRVIEGSIDSGAAGVRVTVHLVDAASGVATNPRAAEGTLDSLPTLRRRVVQEVVALLGRDIGERHGPTSGAELLYLRAEAARKGALAIRSRSLDTALQLDQRADSLAVVAERSDRHWIDPFLLRARIAYDQASLADAPAARQSRLDAAITRANEALAIDSVNADALDLRGQSRLRMVLQHLVTDSARQTRVLNDAQADLDRAVEIDPSLANAWYALATLDFYKRDIVAARLAAERSYEADPFMRFQSGNVHHLFVSNYDLEQFANAQRWCDTGRRQFPDDFNFALCQLMMLMTPWARADPANAWAEDGRLDSLIQGQPHAELTARTARTWVAGALARAGLADSARHVLLANRATEAMDPHQQVAFAEAAVRVILGDQDEAIRLLQRYVLANPSRTFPVSNQLHWWWRPLRNNPKYSSLTGLHR